MVGINMGTERPHSASTAGEEHARISRQARRFHQNNNYLQPTMDELEERNSVRSTSTQASTVATTASLGARLAALNMDYDTKPGYEPSLGIPLEGSEGSGFSSDSDADTGDGTHERRGGSVGTIEPIIPRLPPFMVCSRLFIIKGNHPVQLKRISIQQCEELKLHGYTIIDNFIPKDVSAAVKATALAQFKRGRMVEGGRPAVAAGLPPDSLFVDRVMRGDHVMWLSMGKPPADSTPVAQMLVALQELYEDLAQFVRLRRSTGEYQLGVQPAGAFGMSRHRDALPDNGRGGGSSHLQPSASTSSYTAAAAAASALAVASSSGAAGAPAAGPAGTSSGAAALLQAALGSHSYTNGSGHGSSAGHTPNLSAATSSLAGAGAGVGTGEQGPTPTFAHPNGGAVGPAGSGAGGHGKQGAAGPSSSSSSMLAPAGVGPGGHGPSNSVAAGQFQGSGSQGQLAQARPSSGSQLPVVSGLSSLQSSSAVRAEGAGPSSQPHVGGPPGHRRVTCMVCCNPEWEKEHGGVVRVWPPRRSLGPSHAAGGRRSLTGSEAGTSQLSEDRSDTYSLRSHYFGGTGGASVTSSMWAELGAQEHETASVDNFSVADPADQKEQREGIEWVEIDGEMALDIAPLPGRVVVLLSGAVDHGVSPCTADLASATAWYQ